MNTPLALSLGLLALPLATFAQDDMGKTTFMICTACHGPDGKGLPAGDKTMAPTLSGSKIANGDPSIFALVVLKGIQKESDQYLQAMAPLPLPDKQLAAVMTYVRSSFGNQSEAVTEEQVKGYREKWAATPGPLTRAKIEELSKAQAEAKAP